MFRILGCELPSKHNLCWGYWQYITKFYPLLNGCSSKIYVRLGPMWSHEVLLLWFPFTSYDMFHSSWPKLFPKGTPINHPFLKIRKPACHWLWELHHQCIVPLVFRYLTFLFHTFDIFMTVFQPSSPCSQSGEVSSPPKRPGQPGSIHFPLFLE